MKILAVVDVHPLTQGKGRGLFARVAKGANEYFDLPISKEQAGLLLENFETFIEPAPPPAPTPQEENLFSEFATGLVAEVGGGHRMAAGEDEYYDEDDDL